MNMADDMLTGALIRMPNMDTTSDPIINVNAPTCGGSASVCHLVDVKNSIGETPSFTKMVSPLEAMNMTNENVTIITNIAQKKVIKRPKASLRFLALNVFIFTPPYICIRHYYTIHILKHC
jgi:hypothetical protein